MPVFCMNIKYKERSPKILDLLQNISYEERLVAFKDDSWL